MLIACLSAVREALSGLGCWELRGGVSESLLYNVETVRY